MKKGFRWMDEHPRTTWVTILLLMAGPSCVVEWLN